MQLSTNFSYDEMVRSDTAARLGIPNSPGPLELKNLTSTAQQMEQVRTLVAGPVFITSAYRSPAVNQAVGGVSSSAHCQGWAVDFTCPGWSNYDLACAIRDSGIQYDQVIKEYGWIHLSFHPQMRRMELTKRSASSPYEQGIQP